MAILVGWRVVVLLSVVNVLAKVASPFLAIFCEFNKRVDISATILASNNRFAIEAAGRNFFATWKLSIRLDEDGQRYATIFG